MKMGVGGVNVVNIICPPLVGIGVTDLLKNGEQLPPCPFDLFSPLTFVCSTYIPQHVEVQIE
jgi:hypothetical protein